MKTIPLTRGLVALVDDEDYEWLSRWRWFVRRGKGTSYASRKAGNQWVHMHREIARARTHEYVDHANRNGLDNQKSNLRLATVSQNNTNRGYRNNQCGYRGVSKNRQLWRAHIQVNRQPFYLGSWTTPEAAARAYDRAALKHFGEFAWLNFPQLKDNHAI